MQYTCDHCEATFERRPCDVRSESVYCSRACTSLARRSQSIFFSIQYKQRQAVIRHYGPACAECGEDRPEVLQVDHINNDGADHRREIGNNNTIWAWLVQQEFPPGFQVLCANCHAFKTFYECHKPAFLGTQRHKTSLEPSHG